MPAKVPVTNASLAEWTSVIEKFFSLIDILFSLQISMTAFRVMPGRQYFPIDVQTSPLCKIKKFVELQVETFPFTSSIMPSSAPALSASMHATMQLSLLRVFKRGSWVSEVALLVLTVTSRMPFSFVLLSAFLYSGLRLAGIVMRLCTKEQAKLSVVRRGFATYLNYPIDNPTFRGIVHR